MPQQKQILDNLSGFEFEELMMDVFRNLGFENIRNPGKTGDEGRDIIMEKTENGKRTTYIVECKNVSSKVGRPVVQKLDSAVSTYETDNDKKGVIVTTNRFSQQAKGYAEKADVLLWSGEKIREIADEIGLDLYNGKIEIICDDMLSAPRRRDDVKQKVFDKFRDIKNFDKNAINNLEVKIELIPSLYAKTEINSVYETSIGVVNRIDRTEDIVWRADRQVKKHGRRDQNIAKLVDRTSVMEKVREKKFEGVFENIEKKHFDKTETDFKKEIIEKQVEQYTEEVTYTGGNNVTYNKTHKPSKADITVKEISPIYIPKIVTETTVKEHSHNLEFYSNRDIAIEKKDEIHRDTKTGRKPVLFSLTLCQYCGTINNRRNIKNERLEQEPICRHCSTTQRFMLREKHFKNEDNLEMFRDKYEEMAIQDKLLENKLGIAIAASLVIFLLPGLV